MNERDAELIRRFLDGDAEAGQEVADWVSVAASGFRRRLGDACSDAVQDSLLEITGAWRDGAFRGDGSARAYVQRITIHTCLKRLRARQRRRWDLFGHLDEALDVAGLERIDADAVWLTHDLLERIWQRASPACRRIWRWIVEGYSYREIAEIEGESPGALRVRAWRCRRSAEAERNRLAAGKVGGTKGDDA